ncbi:hypothetical protein [Kineococcus rhizosphaerae]|uniref:Dolichyl-phosphate-mannose-protein mannosyltransferase n=1 Tax=Kineococcus rhizosphaerae TaxID=559628 RepID=A0A2T0R2D5_9ACTN|nr:hypothetical protein [Kineococcus rhizosphaerae]PRY13940.1 hypothetical protein CLV37_10758 [Kineococcus rhizosphaerae]
MRGVVTFVLKAFAGLVVLQVVFFALLMGAQAVPNQPIVDHLAQAVTTGDYGDPYGPDGVGGTADRFTECAELGYGVTTPDDPRSLWDLTTGGPRLSSCDDGKGEIAKLAAGEDFQTPATYFRYWSGYSVLTRPVLALTDVPGLRLVVTGVFAAAVLAAFLAVSRRLGAFAGFALFLPIAATTNALAMPDRAFTHGIALATVAAGVAVTAVAASRGWRAAVLGAGFSAALFCYTDLLTVPPMSWALCAGVAAAVTHVTRRDWRETWRTVLAVGAAWPVAFGFTWVFRWFIGALGQGLSVFSRVQEVSQFRLDGGDVSHAFGAGVVANWRFWTEHSITAVPVVVAAAVLLVVLLAVAVKRHGVAGLLGFAAIGLPALVVPAWYCVLSNHSQIHAFFVYRSLPAAVGVLLLAGVVAARRVGRTSAATEQSDHVLV